MLIYCRVSVIMNCHIGDPDEIFVKYNYSCIGGVETEDSEVCSIAILLKQVTITVICHIGDPDAIYVNYSYSYIEDAETEDSDISSAALLFNHITPLLF